MAQVREYHFPKHRIYRTKYSEECKSGDVCIFCLDTMAKGDDSVSIIRCKHCFHTRCIKEYIKERRSSIKKLLASNQNVKDPRLLITCPICRQPLTEDVDKYYNELQQWWNINRRSVIGVLQTLEESILDQIQSEREMIRRIQHSL
jgi:hypothetical protein